MTFFFKPFFAKVSLPRSSGCPCGRRFVKIVKKYSSICLKLVSLNIYVDWVIKICFSLVVIILKPPETPVFDPVLCVCWIFLKILPSAALNTRCRFLASPKLAQQLLMPRRGANLSKTTFARLYYTMLLILPCDRPSIEATV